MHILILGPKKKPQMILHDYLLKDGNTIDFEDKKLLEDISYYSKYDYLISFGYRYLIGPSVLNKFQDKAINLHISYLHFTTGFSLYFAAPAIRPSI